MQEKLPRRGSSKQSQFSELQESLRDDSIGEYYPLASVPANDCMDAGGRAMQEQLPRRDNFVWNKNDFVMIVRLDSGSSPE